MRYWWQKFQAFTKAECDEIISFGLEFPVQDATVGHGGSGGTNHAIRKTKVRWINTMSAKFQWIKLRMQHHMLLANRDAFGFDVSPECVTEVQLLEYGLDDHYDWHEDLNWKPDPTQATPWQRKISMVVQLSDPKTYEGGKLLLDRDPIPDNADGSSWFSKPGDMIFFPSFLRHKACPVTSGVRYVLTGWFTGPNFR